VSRGAARADVPRRSSPARVAKTTAAAKYVVCGLEPETVSLIGRLKRWAQRLRVEVYALFLAYKDPRVPWYARAFAAVVVAYAFSPIDLILDPIPVLGYLDDLVIIPLGVVLAIKMIPLQILAECREEARGAKDGPVSRVAAVVVVALWIALAALSVWLVARVF
jgi:uncharacterized membrane protein YkvA (DUF1232 family)